MIITPSMISSCGANLMVHQNLAGYPHNVYVTIPTVVLFFWKIGILGCRDQYPIRLFIFSPSIEPSGTSKQSKKVIRSVLSWFLYICQLMHVLCSVIVSCFLVMMSSQNYGQWLYCFLEPRELSWLMPSKVYTMNGIKVFIW